MILKKNKDIQMTEIVDLSRNLQHEFHWLPLNLLPYVIFSEALISLLQPHSPQNWGPSPRHLEILGSWSSPSSENRNLASRPESQPRCAKLMEENGFPKILVPQNGWFIVENPIKMDDLGVPLFLETPKWLPSRATRKHVSPLEKGKSSTQNCHFVNGIF